MNFFYPVAIPIGLSLTAYNAFLTGFIVMLKRKDSAGLYYFISSFFIFLWGVSGSFMLHNAFPDSLAESWGVFSQIMALFIPATWLQFVIVYTEQREKYQKVVYAAWLITFSILPFTLTRSFVSGFHKMVGISHYPIPGPAYVAFTIFFAVIILYSFWVFYLAVKRGVSAEKRRDFTLVGFASLYGFTAGSLSFLPVYGINFPQYNLIVMPIWQILLAYAMIRHRAFDLVQIAEAAQKDKLAAIGTLAASINHEIRNPLYVIRGLAGSFIANLQDGVYSNSQQAVEKAREMMGKVEEHSSRAMDIMRRFAVFAKQNGEVLGDKPTASIQEILKSVLPLVSHEIELEKIQLIQNVPDDLSPVHLDARQGEEIFFNLIVNACQAIKLTDAPGKISISASQQNGSVYVEVSDNGPGIPKNRLKQVFEPFYTTKDEGTGLGLYITKQLIEKNQGKISVFSPLGEGTTFKLGFKRSC